MTGASFNQDGIQILDEWIPYEAIIKVWSDKPKTTHTIVFNLKGKERAYEVKTTVDEFCSFKKNCLQKNSTAYFQPYQVGHTLAALNVGLTAVTLMALCATIGGFRKSNTLGFIMLGTACGCMLVNIFVKRKISLMRKNQGDDPKKVGKSRIANKIWRDAQKVK